MSLTIWFGRKHIGDEDTTSESGVSDLDAMTDVANNGRCQCCPYGYHIDVDFVRFLETVNSDDGNRMLTALRKIDKRRSEVRDALISSQDRLPIGCPPRIADSFPLSTDCQHHLTVPLQNFGSARSHRRFPSSPNQSLRAVHKQRDVTGPSCCDEFDFHSLRNKQTRDTQSLFAAAGTSEAMDGASWSSLKSHVRRASPAPPHQQLSVSSDGGSCFSSSRSGSATFFDELVANTGAGRQHHHTGSEHSEPRSLNNQPAQYDSAADSPAPSLAIQESVKSDKSAYCQVRKTLLELDRIVESYLHDLERKCTKPLSGRKKSISHIQAEAKRHFPRSKSVDVTSEWPYCYSAARREDEIQGKQLENCITKDQSTNGGESSHRRYRHLSSDDTSVQSTHFLIKDWSRTTVSHFNGKQLPMEKSLTGGKKYRSIPTDISNSFRPLPPVPQAKRSDSPPIKGMKLKPLLITESTQLSPRTIVERNYFNSLRAESDCFRIELARALTKTTTDISETDKGRMNVVSTRDVAINHNIIEDKPICVDASVTAETNTYHINEIENVYKERIRILENRLRESMYTPMKRHVGTLFRPSQTSHCLSTEPVSTREVFIQFSPGKATGDACTQVSREPQVVYREKPKPITCDRQVQHIQRPVSLKVQTDSVKTISRASQSLQLARCDSTTQVDAIKVRQSSVQTFQVPQSSVATNCYLLQEEQRQFVDQSEACRSYYYDDSIAREEPCTDAGMDIALLLADSVVNVAIDTDGLNKVLTTCDNWCQSDLDIAHRGCSPCSEIVNKYGFQSSYVQAAPMLSHRHIMTDEYRMPSESNICNDDMSLTRNATPVPLISEYAQTCDGILNAVPETMAGDIANKFVYDAYYDAESKFPDEPVVVLSNDVTSSVNGRRESFGGYAQDNRVDRGFAHHEVHTVTERSTDKSRHCSNSSVIYGSDVTLPPPPVVVPRLAEPPTPAGHLAMPVDLCEQPFINECSQLAAEGTLIAENAHLPPLAPVVVTELDQSYASRYYSVSPLPPAECRHDNIAISTTVVPCFEQQPGRQRVHNTKGPRMSDRYGYQPRRNDQAPAETPTPTYGSGNVRNFPDRHNNPAVRNPRSYNKRLPTLSADHVETSNNVSHEPAHFAQPLAVHYAHSHSSLKSNDSMNNRPGSSTMINHPSVQGQPPKRNLPGVPQRRPWRPESEYLDEELYIACAILNECIYSPNTGDHRKVTSALSVIQQDWFKVTTEANANLEAVQQHIQSFRNFSNFLLERIVNMTDANGNTALHLCVCHGYWQKAKLLIETRVCDIDLYNAAGFTALMQAAAIELLSEESVEMFRLMARLSRVNLRSLKDGQSALMIAVIHGRIANAGLLLECGAEANLQDARGTTSLMHAIKTGNLKMVEVIVGQPDCDMSIVDCENNTAMTIASRDGRKDILVALYGKMKQNKGFTTRSPRTSRCK